MAGAGLTEKQAQQLRHELREWWMKQMAAMVDAGTFNDSFSDPGLAERVVRDGAFQGMLAKIARDELDDEAGETGVI